MSKERLTNQLKNAYKQLEEEFKNKGRPNTIEDNNVDYDNCNIYAMRQKIKDLEAKLAEMTEKYNACQEARKLENEFSQQDKKELKQQLAESEKENNELHIAINKMSIDLTNLLKGNQDKISFAVAELEKVKVLIHNAVNIDSPEYDLVGLYDAVSNQIKAIKGEEK